MTEKNRIVKRDEVQVSHDIVNLYLVVIVNEALDVLIDQLKILRAICLKENKTLLKRYF